MKIPNTVSENTLKAYENIGNRYQGKSENSQKKILNALNFQWETNLPVSLKDLCIKVITHYWQINPMYSEIENIEDRNALLDEIDVKLPIKLLSTYIFEDTFWQRCFQYRWPFFFPSKIDRPWINIYVEKHLAEVIENLKPINFDEEEIKTLLETCSPFVRTLKIRQLQPSLSDPNYHIPFEGILSSLAELRVIDLTYDLKTIGAHDFFLGCTSVAKQDIESLAFGIEKCYELVEFRLHSTKLEPFMLELIANALDKSCSKLETIEFSHCGFGDEGLKAFVKNLNQESFQHLRHLTLTNNFLTNEGSADLITLISKKQLLTLYLKFNPLGSNGVGEVLNMFSNSTIENIDISCCDMDDSVGGTILKFLEENRCLKAINLSSNMLNSIFGEEIVNCIANIKYLEFVDVRYCGINPKDKLILESKLLDNIENKKNSNPPTFAFTGQLKNPLDE